MHQPERSKSPLEKWQLGMDRLAKAKEEPDLLGLAMLSIHGALEDQFRQILASLLQLSVAERHRVQDVSQVQWRELCNLMQKYVGLSDGDVKYIMQMNSMRIKAGHGGHFPGSDQDVAKYADFVKGWLEVAEVSQSNYQSYVSARSKANTFKFDTVVWLIAGLVFPLWPISLIFCWYMAYRSYKRAR
ncbi:hypothetical protein [Allocoleopsis sp.]|uniref:hypothetical protein n=1 Tax=Allocoleopsis sp. TaxID=3088169 RepID=UPI002FD63A64